MKLYKCQMLDESMYDWEECIVAVMENYGEQNFYYFDEPNRSIARKKLLADSGYTDYDEDDIEFWFAYEIEGFNYANSIAKNIAQHACDCAYANFKLIKQEGMSEVYVESEG